MTSHLKESSRWYGRPNCNHVEVSECDGQHLHKEQQNTGCPHTKGMLAPFLRDEMHSSMLKLCDKLFFCQFFFRAFWGGSSPPSVLFAFHLSVLRSPINVLWWHSLSIQLCDKFHPLVVELSFIALSFQFKPNQNSSHTKFDDFALISRLFKA